MLRILFVSLLLSLTGCATQHVEPLVVPIPDRDENVTYFSHYQKMEGFNGYEVTVGIPALGWIPVVGSFLDEMFRFRAGGRQDILVPVMEESQYVQEARARAAAARARWHSAGVRRSP